MEVYLYNWERKAIMRWFNFVWSEKENERFIHIDVEISKSIFEASLSIEVSSIALAKFKENLNLLYNQVVTKVTYVSCDGLLKIELFRNEVGHVYQMLHISDLNTRSSLVVKDYFDQTFLPELENSINRILK